MLTLRRAEDRGHFDFGWLDTHHTFSFGDYRDARHMGFRVLRVINEDRVQPGRGFPTHGHRDMEIVTYVLEGAISHQDSLGTGSTILPGEVQRMSAGAGITHSEFNASKTACLHLLQIWLLPTRPGGAPSYEQRSFPAGEKQNRLRLVASPDGREGAVTVHQDVDLYVTLLDPGASVTHGLRPRRFVWVQVARGTIEVDGHRLTAGDGAAIGDVSEVRLTGAEAAEVLLFDLP
jgi:redox-sensitive bicupin YhaK (pirin superfamily)